MSVDPNDQNVVAPKPVRNDLIIRIESAVRTRLDDIRHEFCSNRSSGEPGFDDGLAALDRLKNMKGVWPELGKLEAGNKGQPFKKVTDLRFLKDESNHRDGPKTAPMRAPEDQIVAVSENIITIAAWLLLVPPERLSRADQAALILEVDGYIEGLEKAIDFIDKVKARRFGQFYTSPRAFEAEVHKMMKASGVGDQEIKPLTKEFRILGELKFEREVLDKPIFKMIQHERESGNWQSRAQVVLLAANVKLMLGEYHFKTVSKIMSAGLGLAVSEDAVKGYVNSASEKKVAKKAKT